MLLENYAFAFFFFPHPAMPGTDHSFVKYNSYFMFLGNFIIMVFTDPKSRYCLNGVKGIASAIDWRNVILRTGLLT